MKLAPIVLFVYKRLNETRQTIESLKKCPEAKESELYIFSDGSKGDQDIKKVSDVRQYLLEIEGFKKVEVFESNINKGLAASVIEGLTRMISEYESVIVMEDDLIVSTEFLSFMNRALDFYRYDKRIWSISGHSDPIQLDIKKDVYLSLRMSSWGWAVWRDRLQMVDWDISDYQQFIESREMRNKFNIGGADLTPMLRMQHDRLIDSWAIRFAYSQFKHGMMTVHPAQTLVINIGFGEGGTHTLQVPKGYENQVMCNRRLKLSELEPSEAILEKLRRFHGENIIFDIINKHNIKKNSDIVIYGAAANGKRMYLMLKDAEYNIIAFSDSNKEKWGSVLYGLEIISPEQILEREFDYILVASSRFKEIKDYLLKLGIANKKIIVFDLM